MRRKRHVRTGEAWQFCYVCGHEFPMSELTLSQSRHSLGQWVCTETCVDDVTLERAEKEIARKLSQGVQFEGTDTRELGRRFFGNPEN